MTETNPYQSPESHVQPPNNPPSRLGSPTSVDASRGWEWIAEGFQLFKPNAGLWIGIHIILIILIMMASIIPLASSILMPIFMGGLMIACRDTDQGAPLRLDHLFEGFQNKTGKLALVGALQLGSYVVIMILIVIIMMIFFGIGALSLGLSGDNQELAAAGFGIAILIGLLLFMVLMVPIAMAFWFAPLLVALHDIEPIDAIKLSFFACLKNAIPFLIYGIALSILFILASLPLMLGLIVAIPVMVLSIYTSYRDIFLKEI